MQTALLLLGLAASAFANVIERQVCNADNCLRGIRGTNGQPPMSSRLVDCSSFQLATVTPAPVTVTTTVATVIVTEVPITARAVFARQATVSPSSVPAYATYCSASARYASACSCLGITKTTTTLATPTVTETTTATTTVAPPSFTCSPADSASACGGTCDGTCFPDVNGVGYCKQSRPCSGLTPCTLDSDCASGICLVNGCGSVCADVEYLCPNTSSAKFLFTKPEAFDASAKQEKITKA
ncbi:uncharacterized protein PAC_05960 [Phialocephala subalpina]|uniref:Uncharacterized protein n=1 Tax=Phialocephala subalpina TaxID=576137 RepID=A0A1L7WTH2_9HELO|nr:uncharacterized protein PAC_05960 [Phialocephala subalpina]